MKGMAIHSSILAWRIIWTEEAGRLRSMGPQESHDWATNAEASRVFWPLTSTQMPLPRAPILIPPVGTLRWTKLGGGTEPPAEA